MSTMEVDTDDNQPMRVSPTPVHLWCYLGKEGTKRIRADLDLSELTLKCLKEFVCETIETVSPHEIDIVYNGGKMKDDDAVKSAIFKPMNIIIVLKRILKTEPAVDVAAASKIVSQQIPQIALAVRTAFFNPNFVPTIEKLGQSDMLENIMAIATGLQDDPVGLALIQDPAMIFHLSDVDSIKRLAETKPWVVEALNYLAGSVHQEKGQSSTNRNNAPLFNPAFYEGDEEDMEEEDADGEAGPSNRITREQLSAALNSLNALGRGALSSVAQPPARSSNPQPSSTSFLDLLSQAGGVSPSPSNPLTAPRPSPQTTGSVPTPDFGRLLSAALPGALAAGGAAAGTPQVTPEMVARAMTTALNSLPADARQSRFNELRDHIARIQNSGATPFATPMMAPASNNPPPTSTPQASNLPPPTGQYSSQLLQMRDMGIHDERLSVLALRVSDGDVGTAVDLIFSGWTGEGADAPMSDEE